MSNQCDTAPPAPSSSQAYFKSVEVSGEELGPDHPVSMAFAERADEAQSKLEEKIKAKAEAARARGKGVAAAAT
eukprot:CAMPEP_0113691080 /NCGR_PEP_ID=MMETSP0038_2-20120614/18203_1 /TAXON_ID=2898 /ORGANISM="Cryptomonas paramecium" /LENGTH=73 /DNA_ID=CAMNT_0000612587 /DNA_START=47 /DNA_END=264 /DNA_ORIENTATION=- /assembly_acc=CAM_ASM_000170